MDGTFLQSAGILLREGLEAMLVVTPLAVYLGKAGAHNRLPALYAGGALAIVASVAAAWIFEQFYSGVHDDVVEGVTIFAAAGLMLYVSGWLLVRQDPRVWQSYLQRQANQALANGTVLAVGALAFLAVFREGAETVLFIHALAKTAGGWTISLIGGLAAAAAVLAAVFFGLRSLMLRLPLRAVFLVTSGFLFVMALKFIGQGIQEFQEQQLLPYNPLGDGSWLLALGLNPTLEALAAQAIVVALAVVSFAVLRLRRGRVAPAARASVLRPSPQQ
jgi:high-affinity iron transporter